MAKQRKRSNKTEARRRKLLIESASKFGYITGAKEMQAKAAEVFQEYVTEREQMRYVGDVLGFIGMAVWLGNHLASDNYNGVEWIE